MGKPVLKAVFPVAGVGDGRVGINDPMGRLSELRPIVDRPIIQFAIEEARAAGIEEFIFVTCSEKAEFESHVAEAWPQGEPAKTSALSSFNPGEAVFVRQPERRGIGHAILMARPFLDDAPFAVIIPNLFVLGDVLPLTEMVGAYEDGTALIGAAERTPASLSKFGVLQFHGDASQGEVAAVVEKPAPEHAPSTMAAFGRWILPAKALDILADLDAAGDAELSLTTCINALTKRTPVRARTISGTTFDLRDHKELVRATVAYALTSPDVRPTVTEAYEDFVDAGVSTVRSVQLSRRYGELSSFALLAQLIERDFRDGIALVSSFGADSAVLLHMISRIDPKAPVLFMDTGRLFDETLDYSRSLGARLGLQNIMVVRPDPGDVAKLDADLQLYACDADACCNLRKTMPMERALEPFACWITGRKRYQNAVRTKLPLFEEDRFGRVKVNPLAAWSKNDITDYMDRYVLPPHPLVAKGYPSIGCYPCTSQVAKGEDERAGRWRGAEKTECGIHFVDGKVVRTATS